MKIKNGQPKTKRQKKDAINLDNEIIIGLNTKTVPKKVNKPKTKKSIKAKKKSPKKSHNSRILKVLIILILFIVALAFFLLSEIFNCKGIEVSGNNKISSEEIINLSGIKTEENIFKINTRKVKESLKGNPYINTVKIKRRLNGTVEIIIEERNPTYMLICERGCLYINNQGYILEIAEEPIPVPTIMGFKTDFSVKQPGDRLDNEDLLILEKVISITDIANSKGLKDLITYINVSNIKDIVIYMDEEKKTIHFGDEQDVSKKFDRLKVVMEQEKGNEGEIFIQDIENIYFREKV